LPDWIFVNTLRVVWVICNQLSTHIKYIKIWNYGSKYLWHFQLIKWQTYWIFLWKHEVVFLIGYNIPLNHTCNIAWNCVQQNSFNQQLSQISQTLRTRFYTNHPPTFDKQVPLSTTENDSFSTRACNPFPPRHSIRFARLAFVVPDFINNYNWLQKQI